MQLTAHKRRMVETGALLVDHVLPHRPICQRVLSFPYPLRFVLVSHPQVRGKVLDIVSCASCPTCAARFDQQGGLQSAPGTHGYSDIDMAPLIIRSAVAADNGEMFALQRAAYVDEGVLYGTFDVPALSETQAQFKQRISMSHSWVAIDQARMVGAVSVRKYEGNLHIERLLVAPDCRGEKLPQNLSSELRVQLSKLDTAVCI